MLLRRIRPRSWKDWIIVLIALKKQQVQSQWNCLLSDRIRDSMFCNNERKIPEIIHGELRSGIEISKKLLSEISGS